MRELYINGKLVDLLPAEPIATSYQISKIAEVQDIQSYFSNRFNLPATDNNKKIFGFANDIGSTSAVPYRVLPCRIIENGVDLIEDAVAILVSWNDGFEIEVYSGLYDFFSQIKDKKIADIDTSDINFIFTASNVASLSGDVLYPLADYGANESGFASEIYLLYQEPAVRFSYLINKIFESTDWGKYGEFFSLDKYKDLYLLCTGDPITASEELLTSRSFNVGGNDFTFTNQFYSARYFTSLLSNGRFDSISDSGEYDSTAGCLVRESNDRWYYQAAADTIVDITFNLWFLYNTFGVISVFKNSYNPLVGSINNAVIDSSEEDFTSGHWNKTYQGIRLNAGDRLYIVTYNTNTAAVFYEDGTLYGEPDDKSFIEIKAVNSSVVNSTISINTLLPDITQVDLIRNLCNLFGIIMQPDVVNRRILFKQFKSISEDNIIVDWSNKLDLSVKETISFHPEGYFQNNWMRWIQSDSRGVTGDAYFAIDDTTLEKEGNIVELDFASSLPKPNLIGSHTGITIERYIKKDISPFQYQETYGPGAIVEYNGSYYIYIDDNPTFGSVPPDWPSIWSPYYDIYDFQKSTDARLVYVRNVDATIKLFDGTNQIEVDNVYIAWFSDPLQPYNLDFQWLIQNEWYAVVNMLQRYKEVVVYMAINGVDISNIDFFKLIGVEYFGDKFYLDSIEEYIGESSTKVRLIRI